ncbi:MAG TPA: FAD-dependent oxidoreductase [Acidimicrobiales bacterium]|nr:FAD-dependent oxidoreductase [Acidimicrobiales bacterium]
MAQRVDVAVIGAGAMGSATAWWLARRGRSVALIEQFAQGHARGSSHGASRIFRYAYADPRYVRMAQEALPLWRELEDDVGQPLLEITGGLDHGRASLVEPVAEALAAGGVDHARLTPEAAVERWPGMRFEGTVIHCPGAGRCLADASVLALQQRAASLGADVRFSSGPATLTWTEDTATVRTPGDEWRAHVAVVTAGAWLPTVVGSRIARPPLRITRERVQHFRPVRPADEPSWPSFIHHRTDAWRYGLLSPGEGVKVAEHMTGPVVDPDDGLPAEADAGAATDRVRRYVEHWFPGLDPAPIHPATCLYTTTPTHDFVLERQGPIVIGSACSGHGFKFTPLVGRILADLATAAG